MSVQTRQGIVPSRQEHRRARGHSWGTITELSLNIVQSRGASCQGLWCAYADRSSTWRSCSSSPPHDRGRDCVGRCRDGGRGHPVPQHHPTQRPKSGDGHLPARVTAVEARFLEQSRREGLATSACRHTRHRIHRHPKAASPYLVAAGTAPTPRLRSHEGVRPEVAGPGLPIEGGNGISGHSAHRLLAVGEQVVEVPPKLSAQGRVFSTGQGVETDATDATRSHRSPPVSGCDQSSTISSSRQGRLPCRPLGAIRRTAHVRRGESVRGSGLHDRHLQHPRRQPHCTGRKAFRTRTRRLSHRRLASVARQASRGRHRAPGSSRHVGCAPFAVSLVTVTESVLRRAARRTSSSGAPLDGS